MKEDLQNNAKADSERNWLNNGVTQINDVLRKYQDRHSELYQNLINFLARYLDSGVGCIYVLHYAGAQKSSRLIFEAGYAIDKNSVGQKEIRMGDGWIGQAAAEQKTIFSNNIPDSYLKIFSGSGNAKPKNITSKNFSGEVKIQLNNFFPFYFLFFIVTPPPVKTPIRRERARNAPVLWQRQVHAAILPREAAG